MVDTIFDMDDTHVVQQNITYQYQPSPHLHSIRHVIAKRCHGKRKRLSDAKEDEKEEEPDDSCLSLQKKSKTKNKLSKPQDFCRDSGLPSPPVEMVSTEFLPGTPPPSSPKVVHANDQSQKKQLRHAISGLTATEILTKLDDLKAEKHRLFQIMKRLVQEEAVREREGGQAPSASNSVDGENRDEENRQHQLQRQQQYQQLPQRCSQSSHLSTPPEEHQKYSTSYSSPAPPPCHSPASASASASAATLHVSSPSSSSSSTSPSFSYFRSYDRHPPRHSHHRPLSSPSSASTSSRPYPSSAWSNLPRHPLPQS
ncbi:hypothetical protein BCR43DRAFT_486233 [Syncephalastrum racemosum]|uniref:Uncharacterized protein n=1 Tax=Syncephalastrum racemosum TaxID=13706 RepID=A0A1X2HNT5_SYNRA|nr:hypothetical protein BCR43DRAFT_486233 [Syncephalastrum racemosum]